MDFKERVDKDALEYILDHPDLFDICKAYVGGVTITDYQSIFTLYSTYLNRLNADGYVTNKYTRRGSCRRLFSKELSLTNISRRIRHTIAKDYNIDIDIKNCHPVFLQKYCLDNNIECSELTNYINNRDSIIDSLIDEKMDRDTIKVQYLTIINGGKNHIEALRAFDLECKYIREQISLLNQSLYKKLSVKTNPLGSLVNHIMIEMEDKALNAMISYLKEEGIVITSLAYDGLMIERTDDNLRNLQRIMMGCEKAVHAQLGVNVSIVEKEMTEGYELPIEYMQELRQKKSDLNALKLLKEQRCECLIDHSMILLIVKDIVKKLNIKSTGEPFNNLCLFLDTIQPFDCLIDSITKITINFGDISRQDIISYYETYIRNKNNDTYDWKWVLNYLPPRSIQHKEVQKMIPVATAEVIDEYATQNLQIKHEFDSKDDIYDMIEYYKTTIFYYGESHTRDFLHRVDRYCKKIIFPPCYVVNKGAKGIDIEKDVICETIYEVKVDTGLELRTSQLIGGGGCVMKDIMFYKDLPLYSNITFQPDSSQLHNGEYNMYEGMKASKVDAVDIRLIQPILTHIKTCWASGDENIYDYILQWFRIAFGKPGEKTGIVLLLMGQEGTGKGILVDNLIIPFIYGDKVACVSQGLGPITQRFNSICMNKLMICCNEVSSEGGFHSTFDVLKAIITDKTISIEKKGIDIFKDYPNYINFIMTTNNPDGVKLGRTDRRYCCLETSSIYKGDYDYFDELLSYCNQEVANHFYTYCISLPRTRNIKAIPMTGLKEEMMLNSMTSTEKFITEIKNRNFTYIDCKTKTVPDKDTLWEDIIKMWTDSKGWIGSKLLYDAYKRWGAENKETVKSNTMFGREAKRLLENKKSSGVMYKLN